MLHATVEETAAVGLCKVAAVCKVGVVGYGGACYTTGAERSVMSVLAIVIDIALKTCLVKFPICGKVLPLRVEPVNGVVPESVVVGRENEVPHAYFVNAAKETATKQQGVLCYGCEWCR